MAYFDNAATTFPKPDIVYEFMSEFYKNSGANAGRGNYSMAQSAGALLKDTRKRIQELFYCPAKQVVFTPTATIALNIIIQGLIKKGMKNMNGITILNTIVIDECAKWASITALALGIICLCTFLLSHDRLIDCY